MMRYSCGRSTPVAVSARRRSRTLSGRDAMGLWRYEVSPASTSASGSRSARSLCREDAWCRIQAAVGLGGNRASSGDVAAMPFASRLSRTSSEPMLATPVSSLRMRACSWSKCFPGAAITHNVPICSSLPTCSGISSTSGTTMFASRIHPELQFSVPLNKPRNGAANGPETPHGGLCVRRRGTAVSIKRSPKVGDLS